MTMFGAVLVAQHIIRPDTHWNDTAGARIEAHAAGLLQSPTDGRWYWYGQTRLGDTRGQAFFAMQVFR